jgi:uncharacterized protein (DUF2342 family)
MPSRRSPRCPGRATGRCSAPATPARRRGETDADDVFVERLLGIRLGDDQVARGKNFVQGIVDRVGEHELTRMFTLADPLPTPSEIEAPGLWIARVSGA